MAYQITSFLSVVEQTIPTLSESQRERFTEIIEGVISMEVDEDPDDLMTFDAIQYGISDALSVLFEGLPLDGTYDSICESIQRAYNDSDLPT